MAEAWIHFSTPASISHRQLREIFPFTKIAGCLSFPSSFPSSFPLDSPSSRAHISLHILVRPSRLQGAASCLTSAIKSATPKTLGLASCRIPRIVSRPFALPLRSLAAKFIVRSLPSVLLMSSLLLNFQTTSPPRPSPLLSPLAVPWQIFRPLSFSLRLRPLKPCVKPAPAVIPRLLPTPLLALPSVASLFSRPLHFGPRSS